MKTIYKLAVLFVFVLVLSNCEEVKTEPDVFTVSVNTHSKLFTAWENSFDVIITTKSAWSIRNVPDWITVSDTSGLSQDTIAVKVSMNGKSAFRRTNLIIETLKDTAKIDIAQSGMPTSEAVIYTNSVTHISEGSARTGGSIVDEGGETILSKGVCWSTSPSPTIEDARTIDNYVSDKYYNSYLTGLKAGTLYYLRSYCLNNDGVKYGPEVSFSTKSIAINTTLGSLILCVRADCGGIIETEGTGETLTTRGVCYSTSPLPTIEDAHVQAAEAGKGTFSVSIYGLTPSTKYYLRAYAINQGGVYYGEVESITTMDGLTAFDPPTVVSYDAHSGNWSAKIKTDGGLIISERGIYWSTSPDPGANDNVMKSGSGMGTYTGSISGLRPSTTYYFRPYAVSAAGTFLGDVTSFTTKDAIVLISTKNVYNISGYGAYSGGTISSDGGDAVTQRGLCWSTTPNPTTAQSKLLLGTGIGTYSSSLGNLQFNTTYYVRAYAINSTDTYYGNELVFSTLNGVASVLTTNATYVSKGTCQCGGTVTSDGGLPISEKGVCWSTTAHPTVSNSKVIGGSGTGAFSVAVSGLAVNTIYYMRAYVINAAGTVYGNEISFITDEAGIENFQNNPVRF